MPNQQKTEWNLIKPVNEIQCCGGGLKVVESARYSTVRVRIMNFALPRDFFITVFTVLALYSMYSTVTHNCVCCFFMFYKMQGCYNVLAMKLRDYLFDAGIIFLFFVFCQVCQHCIQITVIDQWSNEQYCSQVTHDISYSKCACHYAIKTLKYDDSLNVPDLNCSLNACVFRLECRLCCCARSACAAPWTRTALTRSSSSAPHMSFSSWAGIAHVRHQYFHLFH